MNLPHPLSHSLSREQLEQGYLNIRIDRSPEAAWHFSLNLRRDTRIAPEGAAAPSKQQPFVTLALFQRPDPLYDLEIFGLDLPAEINPADWLDLWLEQHKMVVSSSKPLGTDRGVFGDCVCAWETPQGPFAGRFAALRWGRRVFLLTMRAPRDLYPRIAEEFFLALASFRPIDVDEANIQAEAHQEARFSAPVGGKVRLPVSYSLRSDLSEATVAAFGAEQETVPALSDDPAFGKLNFLFADKSLADHPAKAAALYMTPLLKNPITLHGDQFDEEAAAPAPFQQAWLLTAPATLNLPNASPVPCEIRCRVLAHPSGWLVAGVFGPARHAAPIAWMRNKRALELVTGSFEPA